MEACDGGPHPALSLVCLVKGSIMVEQHPLIPPHGGILVLTDAVELLSRIPDGAAQTVYLDPPWYMGARPGLSSQDEACAELVDRLVRHSRQSLHPRGSLFVRFPARHERINMGLVLGQVFEGREPHQISRPIRPSPIRRKGPQSNREIIFLATASDEAIYHSPTRERDVSGAQFDDPRGPYRLESLVLPTRRAGSQYDFNGATPPPGRTWKYSADVMHQLEAKGLIVRRGNSIPRLKRYLDELPPVELALEWDDLPDLCPPSERLKAIPWQGHQEPLALLERIIAMSSNPGDLVVIPFSDSGTAVVAAHALGRRWVGAAQSGLAADHCLARLAQISTDVVQDVKRLHSHDLHLLPKREIGRPRALASASEVAAVADRMAQVERLGWPSLVEASLAQALWRRGVPAVAEFHVPGTALVLDFFLPSPPRGAVELIKSRLVNAGKIGAVCDTTFRAREAFGETLRIYAVILGHHLEPAQEEQLRAAGVLVVNGDENDLDTVASQIADDFLAHRPSGAADIRAQNRELTSVPERNEFSAPLAALAITYEGLFKGEDREVFHHELAVLRTEITNEHFTAAALRIGRSLEYVVYAACRSWGVPVREPVLAALKRIEDRFEELRAALLEYSAIENGGEEVGRAKRRVKERADGITKAVSDIVFDIDESATAKLEGPSPPRNIQAMLIDIRKRHARLSEVRKNIDHLLKGDHHPVKQLLDKDQRAHLCKNLRFE
jgi:hypothetical protein